MLAAKPKTRRYLEAIQFLLTFVSTCAVAETTRVESGAPDRPGYHASVPQGSETERDRRYGDLARTERKRREVAQQTSRRGLRLAALEQRQLRAGGPGLDVQ